MANEEFLVVADLDGSAQDSRIFLAAPITVGRDRGALRRAHRRRGDRAMERARRRRAGPAAATAGRAGARGQAARQARPREAQGGDARRRAPARPRPLPWSDELAQWRERVAFLRRLDESWPDLSDEALLASLETWLAPFLDGVSRRDHLARIDLAAALKTLVPWDQPAPARPAGADPYRGAERLARAGRLCQPGRAHPVGAPAGDVRPLPTRRGSAAARCR